MAEREWPAYADQNPDEGPDDPAPDLELTPAEPVPVDDARLPVETVEGDVLPAGESWRPRQPQIRVFPTWARSRSDALSAATWAVEHYSRLAAMHAIRLPIYWFRLLGWSFVGVGRLFRSWWRWRWDTATGERMYLMPQSDNREYDHLDGRRRDAQKVRGRATWLVLALAAGLTWWSVVSLRPSALWLLALLVVVPVLGWVGRPLGQPLFTRTYTDGGPAPKLTPEVIVAALDSIGIPKLTTAIKNDPTNAVGFIAPGPHRDGPGVRIDLDLPMGVIAGQVMEKRDKLAGALRLSSSQVCPEGDPESHESRLVLWVADKPMSQRKPVVWPLAAKGAVDLFEPFPIGTDPRGRPIRITLMFALMIIGAMTRMGKTATLRLFLLAAALDVRSELHIYELKGSGDLNALEPVAYRLRSGDDDDVIATLLADVKELREEMRRRMKRLNKLPRSVCPENKVTSQLASRRDLGLHPIVLVLDECHLAFEHATHGKEIAAAMIDLGRRGAAAGIIVILATQRPDADAIPTKLTANAILRFCLKVMNQDANDMILGTSAYKNGIRATMFTRKDVGVGYLAGEADDPVITRVAHVDDLAAERIALRARQMRLDAGLLTGEAAGEEFDLELEQGSSILDHIVALWPPDETRLSYAAIAELLAEHRADLFPSCSQEQVSAALRALEVPDVQVNRAGKNRRGVMLGDLEQAIADRDEERAR